jgi:hypothetical protein
MGTIVVRSPRLPGFQDRHGHACRHGRPGRHVALVATVAPRSNTAGTLLLFNNSFRTAKKTQHFTILKISLLTPFKEIIAVYTENHAKQKMQTCRLSSWWDTYLPLGFKGLISTVIFISPVLFLSSWVEIIYSHLTKFD